MAQICTVYSTFISSLSDLKHSMEVEGKHVLSPEASICLPP